jgi:serine/threonine-protein kinase
MKALARNPAERFQSAFELEKALANHVLRSASSVEETSVSLFLQQVMREELEAPSLETDLPSEHTGEADDGLELGRTVAKPGKALSATPAPKPAPERTLTTPAGAQPLPSLNDDDEPSAAPTKDHRPFAGRPKTEQMPALRPSRKLAPLPLSEPSVVLRDSVRTLPDAPTAPLEPHRPHTFEPSNSQTHRLEPVAETLDDAPPVPSRSKGPFVVIGLLAVTVLGLGAGVALTSGEEAPSVPVAEAPPPAREKAPEPPPATAVEEKPSAPIEAPKPQPPQETAELEKPEPVKPESPRKEPAPKTAVPKMGSISVRAVPCATVTIKGRPYEVTGVQKLPAPAGTYKISLVHPKRKMTETVTVQPNETTSVTFSAE